MPIGRYRLVSCHLPTSIGLGRIAAPAARNGNLCKLGARSTTSLHRRARGESASVTWIRRSSLVPEGYPSGDSRPHAPGRMPWTTRSHRPRLVASMSTFRYSPLGRQPAAAGLRRGRRARRARRRRPGRGRRAARAPAADAARAARDARRRRPRPAPDPRAAAGAAAGGARAIEPRLGARRRQRAPRGDPRTRSVPGSSGACTRPSSAPSTLRRARSRSRRAWRSR